MIATPQRSTAHYSELIRILGKKYVRTEIESPYDFISLSLNGVDPNVIVNFRKHFDISVDAMAAMLNTSAPTVYRWIKSKKNLDSISSVKLFGLADLFLYGSDVFKSIENFSKWMALPNTALGGMKPQDLVVYPDGVSKVKDILGRIEHGVYS